MATKSPQSRGRIPTVSELLENPSIRTLMDRWNRNTVVAGVRSFLDELRADLSRRGEAAGWPSLRELAERAARHVTAMQQPSQRPAINATGQFWGSPWIGAPQHDAALERAFAVGREFVAGPEESFGQSTAGDVDSLICRITRAAGALAVHSYSGGIWLALSALATGREVVVGRDQLGEAEPGCSLVTLIASAGALLREVGAANGATTDDYEAAIHSQTAAILRICPPAFCVIGQTRSCDIEQLVPLARDRELALFDALGSAPLADPAAEIPLAPRSARASLAAGANLVIARGDGLTGGPPCGILAGDAHLIHKIATHPMMNAWKLEPLRSAALAAALERESSAPRGESLAPCAELLATPLENLRHRSERLAMQLAACRGIGAAEPVSTQSCCDGVPAPNRTVDSYGVAITPADGDPLSLLRRLAAAPLPVIARVERERVVLDLRTVFPRHDPAILAAVEGEPHRTASEAEGESATPR
jgi:L-seryl-tRNA(Ser) seleniumtransferase